MWQLQQSLRPNSDFVSEECTADEQREQRVRVSQKAQCESSQAALDPSNRDVLDFGAEE